MKKTARKRNQVKVPPHRWADEKRTGHEYLVDAARMAGGVAALERKCGVSLGHIQTLIQLPSRGCRYCTAYKIREGCGLPITAAMDRTVQIRKVIAAELGV